jgi:hypothetical protein
MRQLSLAALLVLGITVLLTDSALSSLVVSFVRRPAARDLEADVGKQTAGGGSNQDLPFCAASSDLQLAENLFMSIPALTQSCIS